MTSSPAGTRPELLLRPLFLLSLGLLLLNDLFLKYALANAFTGKLSDVAGLFVFPYFFAAFRLSFRTPIYWLTALFFTCWKSPCSQPLLDWCQAMGLPLHRVVDYSDLLTLAVLPLSYRYLVRESRTPICPHPYAITLCSIITLLAFAATSTPHKEVKIMLDADRTWLLNTSREHLFNRMDRVFHLPSDSLPLQPADTVYYFHFEHVFPGTDLLAQATVTSPDSTHTLVHLTRIIGADIRSGNLERTAAEIKQLSREDFERLIEEQFRPASQPVRLNITYVSKLRIEPHHISYPPY